ncbi:hypothetical protein [Methanobrevibacter sp.]|uniref:hypothetical protein n=1 Tax=Methanobrevibacter sp. TaxID=66852 RepID=UPI00388D647F
MAIGAIAGGYALISNDGSSQVINDPVSNEISNVSKEISLDDVIIDVLSEDSSQRISADSVKSVQKINASSDSAASLVANADNLTYQIASFMGYAASVGGQPSGGNDHHSYPLQQTTLYDNVNKSDYVLSPNYKDHIFIKKGEDFTDKYAMCVVDGFIPLGNITKSLETNLICHLDCGIGDAYFDLSSPYVYDVGDVNYYLKNGKFPDEIQKKTFEYETNQLNMNYRQLPGQDEIFLNVHDDFTDKYILCIDCGRYVVLGNVTVPLDDIMICDHPTHFGGKNYFNVNSPAVISREEALDTWNDSPYLQELYSNPDYHPVHFDEEDASQLPNEPSSQSFDDSSSQFQIYTVNTYDVGQNLTI